MKLECMMVLLVAAAPVYGATQVADGSSLIVQDVQCRGNRTMSCEFIRGHLHLRAGDALNEDEIGNAQLRLSSLRTFESVLIHLEKGADRGTAVVVIEVEEAGPIAMEWLLGTSARLDSVREVFAGRVAHQNLFGAGKVTDLTVLAATPIAGDAVVEDYNVTLRYADPNLFGSSQYFAIASANWRNARRSDIHGNFSDFKAVQFDMRLGWRFGDFSYLTFGLSNREDTDWIFGRWRSNGSFESTRREHNNALNVIYGWNSEDDLYFPTQGSSFHIGAGRDFGSGSPENRSHVQFRKTWRMQEALLAIKIGGGPNPEYRTSFEEGQLLSVSYARALRSQGSLTRARWYIEPGFGTAGRDPDGDHIYEIGVKAGVRLDLAGYGIVDLYLMGSQDPQR